jgi:hypothetical protein
VQNAKPCKVLTQEIATKDKPAENPFFQAQQPLFPRLNPEFYVW